MNNIKRKALGKKIKRHKREKDKIKDFNNIFNNTQINLCDEIDELHNTTGEEVIIDNNIISNIHNFII
tara:strand:+ start:72 stop:275 length:204 start_codon:yes stop_codon:yes gene_type:complete